MKKNIACPACKGNGYITVMTGRRGDYCGVMNEPCSKCDGTGLNLVDMTNADRIRAMTDKELEQFINHFNICDLRTNDECKMSYCACCEVCVMDWLQQPAKEEE